MSNGQDNRAALRDFVYKICEQKMEKRKEKKFQVIKNINPKSFAFVLDTTILNT